MAEKAAAVKIRVLTYNIHGALGRDGERDFGRIGYFLEKEKIDIALIQELNTLPQTRSTEKDIGDLCSGRFSFFVAAPTVVGPYGWYGNAVLSRFPVSKQSVI